MNRIVVIHNCDDCPFFDNEYYGYDENCMKLDRTIKAVGDIYPIPEDCPLKKTDEDADSL